MITDHSIAGRVRHIFAKYSKRAAADINAADWLYELGLGDLEAIEISLDIEELVDAEGTDAEWEACRTVGDYIAMAERLANEQREAA